MRNFHVKKENRQNACERNFSRGNLSHACEDEALMILAMLEWIVDGLEQRRKWLGEKRARWWKIWTIYINYLKEFYLKCSFSLNKMIKKEVIGKWWLKWIHCHEFLNKMSLYAMYIRVSGCF